MTNFCKAIGLLFSQKLSRLKKCEFFKNNTQILKLSSNLLFSDHLNANKAVFKIKNFFEKFDDFCKAIGLLFSQKSSRLKSCDFFKNNTLILKLSSNLLFSDHLNANKAVFKIKNFSKNLTIFVRL